MKEETHPILKLNYARKRITFLQQVLWTISSARNETRDLPSFETMAEVLAEVICALESLEYEIDWEALELIKQGEKGLTADEETKEADD